MKRFHLRLHHHVVFLQHEPMSINGLLERSGHQSSAEFGNFLFRYYQLRFHSRLHQLNGSASSHKGAVADSWADTFIRHCLGFQMTSGLHVISFTKVSLEQPMRHVLCHAAITSNIYRVNHGCMLRSLLPCGRPWV